MLLILVSTYVTTSVCDGKFHLKMSVRSVKICYNKIRIKYFKISVHVNIARFNYTVT